MGFLDDLWSGTRDTLFGKEGSTDIQERELLSPEQKKARDAALTRGPVTPGAIQPGQVGDINGIDKSQLSLDDLAEFNKGLAEGEAAKILKGLIDQGPDSDFIQTNIRDPLTKEAQEAMGQVGRQSAGEGSFFSSDRMSQDKNIQEAFATAETQAIADLTRESRQLSLEAARGLTDISSLEQQGRLGVLNAEMAIERDRLNAELQVAMKNGDYAQAAAIQNSLNELQAQSTYQQLLNPTKENIALVTDPTQGAIGGFAQGAGAGFGKWLTT